jgi:hypothetical protein
MSVSPFSDDVVPHFSERDARLLSTKITERLRALGVLPSQIGVALDTDGFWFSATLNGKHATARCGQGNFTYDQIAKDLILASTDPEWDRLIISKDSHVTHQSQ